MLRNGKWREAEGWKEHEKSLAKQIFANMLYLEDLSLDNLNWRTLILVGDCPLLIMVILKQNSHLKLVKFIASLIHAVTYECNCLLCITILFFLIKHLDFLYQNLTLLSCLDTMFPIHLLLMNLSLSNA